MARNDPLLRNLDDEQKRQSYAEEHPIASRFPAVAADVGKAYLKREGQKAQQLGDAVRTVRAAGGTSPLDRNQVPIFNPRVPELVQRGAVPYDRQNHAFTHGGPFAKNGEFADLRPQASNPGVQIDDIKAAPTLQRLNLPRTATAGGGTGPVGAVGQAGNAVAAATPAAAGQSQIKRPFSIGPHGEHVYSDGSGGIARTMSDAQIRGDEAIPGLRGSVTTVPDSAFTRPLLSDVLGHTATPEEGIQVAQQNLQRQQGPMFARPTPGDFARADAISIANEDPRSALGIAARNARIRAGEMTPGQRQVASQLATGNQATYGLDANQQTAEANNAATLAQTRASNQGALQRQQLAGQQAMERAQLTRPGPSQVQLADGGLGLLDPRTGTVTRARDARGAPVRLGQGDKLTARQKRINDRIDALNKGTQEQLKAITGLGDSASAEQIAQIRADQARAQGLEIRTDPKTGRMFTNIDGQVVPL